LHFKIVQTLRLGQFNVFQKGFTMPPVNICFDCIPLRSVARWDSPLDAADDVEEMCRRIRQTRRRYGEHNTYFLHNGRCEFHLSNSPVFGTLAFAFEGAVVTDAADVRTRVCDLRVELCPSACDWITPAVADWFRETVTLAVADEFERYLASGSVLLTQQRLQLVEDVCNSCGGFVAMGL
jgi:hypothetical protein